MLNGELERLLMVPTTREQAEAVRGRNAAILSLLNERTVASLLKGQCPNAWWREVRGTIMIKEDLGCPHCNKDTNCTGCAWAEYRGQSLRHQLYCVGAEFGGVTYRDTSRQHPLALILASDAFYLQLDLHVLSSRGLGDGYSDALLQCVADIRLFAEGHIEWAEAVIERGGVPPSS